MIRNLCVVATLVLILGASPVRAEPVTAASSIQEVTVYRGQALVTRTVTLPDAAGELELVVPDLPAQIIGPSTSASAEGARGVTIRAVRFRTRAVAEAPQKEIARIDDEIKGLNRQIYANTQAEALLAARRAHIEKLEAFTAPTANVEMGKGVLNPDTLRQVSEYILKMRAELLPEQIKVHEEAQDLADKMALLARQRAELAGSGGRTVREAVLFVSKTAPGAATIRLSYLVDGADWSPAYNLRLADDGSKVTVEYLAQVQQTSGEDWTGVALTLSTATPAMNAESPLLAPYWVSLVAGQAGDGKSEDVAGYAKRRGDLSSSQYSVLSSWNTLKQSRAEAAWGLNQIAAEGQSLELNADVLAIRGGQEAAQAVAEGLAVSYPLSGRMSVASRPDQQLVQIAAAPLDARSYYVATPLLSPYVWRAANVVNTSPVPMLAGPYSAFIGGEFVGRGNMPLVACGQEVTVGFGVDTELRCTRELKEKSDRVSWGSQVQTFRYELRLENFKKSPVTVRLLDRIPASQGDDVVITLLKTAEPLSTDAMYVRDYKDKGILRWDINLAAESTGVKVRQIEYSFEMKYSKDAHIGREAAPAAAEMRMDLDRMMMQAAQ